MNKLRDMIPSQALMFKLTGSGCLSASLSASGGDFIMTPEVFHILLELKKNSHHPNYNALKKQVENNLKFLAASLPESKEWELLKQEFQKIGILISPSLHCGTEDGFGDPWIQWAMVTDINRLYAYEQILKYYAKNKLVCDVGAGTGILGYLALQSQAKKVYFIEESGALYYCEQALRRLRIPKHKYSLLKINSKDVKIKEPIDLVVSELFGNDPLMEGVIPTLSQFAQHKFCAKATFVPHKLMIMGEIGSLLEHPMSYRIERLTQIPQNKYLSQSMNDYMNCLKKDVLSLKNTSFPLAFTAHQYKRHVCEQNLCTIPLNPPPKKLHASDYAHKVTYMVREDIHAPIFIMWFKVYLDNNMSACLASHPLHPQYCSHWSTIAVPIQAPLQKGDKIICHFSPDAYFQFSNIKLYKNNTLCAFRTCEA